MTARRAANAWTAKSNARSQVRRSAIAALNCLADEVGARKIRTKSNAVDVEKFVRILEKKCQNGDLSVRLRSAVERYVAHGGVFSVPLEPPQVDHADVDHEDCNDDANAEPYVQQHRILKAGYRLESKAFMATYNSATFHVLTWPTFCLVC